MDFKCEICGAEFYHKKNLSGHKSRMHGIKSTRKAGEIPCNICDKRFASKDSLSHHTANVHGIKKRSIECQEENCGQKFTRISELRNHLGCYHGIPDIETCQNLEFVKYEDFNEWMVEEEKKTNSKYVISSSYHYNNCKHTMFLCNRSGVYKPSIIDRQRQLKAQGTSKLGFHCTSNIKVKECDSKIVVSYYKGHNKHSSDLCHLPIPKIDKEIIAGKLQGVDKKRILDDTRKSSGGKIEPKLLISRKDINNIQREFGIVLDSKGSLVNNDEASVFAWVTQMEEEEFNPVRFYKRQGDEHTKIDTKDFMLVIMTEFQRNMLCRYGADRVCIDSTHGISAYGFELVSVMVIDNFEEGIPVAFCIMSTVDTQTLSFFFNCIKEVLSLSLKPKVFMSDDAHMFRNAWESVFGPCDKYLLCAWHVDRAWQSHLNYLKPENREDVYHTLKALMKELDKDKFDQMLKNFMKMLQEDVGTKRFSDYFRIHYYNRPEMWAYCFRKGAKINTNMHIESFHRSLKHIYLEGKKTKRVDKVLNELMKLAYDKTYDTFIKSVKGKITKRCTENFKRHRLGKGLVATMREVAVNNWEVQVSKNVYTVSKNHTCTDCIITCRSCAICSTAYSCTCHDYEISNFVCKHIHFLKISLNETQNFTGLLINKVSSVPVIASTNENCSEDRISRQIEAEREIMFARVNSLCNGKGDWDILQCFKSINKHLLAQIHLQSDTVKNNFISPSNSEPSNKKILKQRRFHSVKKPYLKKKVRVSNPSSVQLADKKAILLKDLYCSRDSSFDHKY